MIAFGPEVWDRMATAVEAVRDRLRRATAALEAAGIDYAVAAWVARIDPVAVRNTQDVDILLRREDMPAATVAMEAAGFVHRHAASMDMFLDGPSKKDRDAVHILFANEKVRPVDPVPTADVMEYDSSEDGRYRHLTLEALVRMKLTSYRLGDQVHLQDMIGVGLIDETWPSKYPTVLAERLSRVLDDPDG